VLDRDDNVLPQVQQYARRHIPRNGAATSYVITWTSYLQPAAPPGYHAFGAMMAHATPVTTCRGFKETVTAWRLPRSAFPSPAAGHNQPDGQVTIDAGGERAPAQAQLQKCRRPGSHEAGRSLLRGRCLRRYDRGDVLMPPLRAADKGGP
jgi:hypothetical protein